MTPTERERIEKEADEYGQWVMDKTKDFHDGINAKDAYVAGATSEHDKARNQGIDACIQIFKDEFSLSGEDVDSEDWILTKRLESLKTIS